MKVGIIGAGSVGSATAFALIMRGVARKVVLVDQNKQRAVAEAMDIAHATPFAFASKIKAGDYTDLAGCEVVIVTAGANQKPGQSRTDLLAVNVKIFEDIGLTDIVRLADGSAQRCDRPAGTRVFLKVLLSYKNAFRFLS